MVSKFKPNVLMSEVFEHISQDEPIGTSEKKKIKDKIKDKINFFTMIIITPDVGFNVHYSSDGDIGLRHPDHKYEYTKEEFKNVLSNIFIEPKYNKNFYQVGDIVDSNSITQSCIIMS